MEDLEKKATELLEKGFAKNLEEANKKAQELVAEEAKKLNEELKKSNEAQAEQIKGLTVKMDESERAVKDALTKMNRLKEEQNAGRVKTMASTIYDTLGEHQEKMSSFVKNKHAFDIEMKAVGTMGVPAGTVAPQYEAPLGIAHELVHARNSIAVSPTSSNMIKYNQFVKKEGAITTVAAGALKPQFDYNVVAKEAAVKKIAGFVQLHDEFLEDIIGARDFLSTELPQALLDAEDMQVFKGDGTGENLSGLYTNAQALSLPMGTVNTDSNGWDKLAASLTQIRKNLRGANAIWVSPEDYLSLLINKASGSGEYDYPIIANAAGQITVGGVPVYQHGIFAAGEALVGDFARGTRIFQKMGAIIKFSTEHGTNFTTNQTTVLIEERIALPIYFPDSFVKVNMTATPVV
jgi:HK97 family phage major capsid protein